MVHEQIVSFELVVDSIQSLDVRLAEDNLRVRDLLVRLSHGKVLRLIFDFFSLQLSPAKNRLDTVKFSLL